jgi:hypothetical protein
MSTLPIQAADGTIVLPAARLLTAWLLTAWLPVARLPAARMLAARMLAARLPAARIQRTDAGGDLSVPRWPIGKTAWPYASIMISAADR